MTTAQLNYWADKVQRTAAETNENAKVVAYKWYMNAKREAERKCRTNFSLESFSKRSVEEQQEVWIEDQNVACGHADDMYEVYRRMFS